MPFATVERPSLALTQLQSVVAGRLGGRVCTTIHNVNHDVARAIGTDLYDQIARGPHFSAGLGDWLFRLEAFPDLPDNAEAYFARYYPAHGGATARLREQILTVRGSLAALLDAIIDRYALDRVDLAGFSSLFSQNMACLALAKQLKERNSRVTVVMGGANCEAPMGAVIARHVRQIDAVFSGPALKSFPEFVSQRLEGRDTRIRGVYQRQHLPAEEAPSGDLLSVLQPAAEELGEELELDAEIALDYDGFLDELERGFPDEPIAPRLPFETSRGCWWGERSHCTFCGLNGATMAFRAMSPERALREFQSLFRYAPRCREFVCVDNILPTPYFTEVLPYLQPPPGIAIFYEIKANLNEEQVRTLARAGVTQIQPGIEALSTKTLRLMKKGSTAFVNLQLLKYCLLHDVCPIWNVLLGMPGQDDEDYRRYVQDFPLLFHLQPPEAAYPVHFDRYSPYFNQSETFGLTLRPRDFYALTYPFPKESLTRLAYFFDDVSPSAGYRAALERWIGPVHAVIAAWQEAWSAGAGLPPALHALDASGSTRIYDSRSGEAVIHQLSAAAARALQFFETPHKLIDLQKELAGADVAGALTELRNRGLIFEEDGRALSLALPRPPLAAGANPCEATAEAGQAIAAML